MSFDVAKWNKQRYLAEAGLLESTADLAANAINQAINTVDESLSYQDFALAVAKILKDEYGSQNFDPFMEILHAELGMKESLSEGAYDVEGTTPDNIDKVDISFVEGSQRLYAVYIYLKGREREYQWDKKLSSSEFQKVLDMLGIELDFKSDPYYYGDATVKALEDKGYTATTSDFDVS
jgi:hypothetical protein